MLRTREHNQHDTVQSERDMDRQAQSAMKDRDPRRSLMPPVMQRSSIESSFGIDALDSQVWFSLFCIL